MSNRPNRQQPKKRNYKDEYARRLARAFAKNLSRAEARGHGKRPLKPKAGKVFSSDQRFLEKGVQLIKSGSSLTETAKQLHVAPERLRNYLAASGVAKKVGSRWRIGPDDRARQMLVFSENRAHKVRVEPDAASQIGAYMNDVGSYLNSNNPKFVKPWMGKHFTDVKGRKHPFETDLNTLYRLNQAGRNSFDEIYRIIT
jgi:hypothetical protein